jgi:lysophospholipid acyltransferase (LPLAT)-like uncharacterized protein
VRVDLTLCKDLVGRCFQGGVLLYFAYPQNFYTFLKLKRWFKKEGCQNVLAGLAAGYLKGVRASSRWTVTGLQHITPYWQQKKPVIVVFWHNQMTLAPFAWKKNLPFRMLISPHSDGAIIAKTVAYFGIEWAAGSSSKSGFTALKTLVRSLASGMSVGLTPDGPQGPCYSIKEGIFSLALISKAPLLALHWKCTRYKRFSSWDRFILPLPFSVVDIAWSPVLLPPQSSEEKSLYLAGVAERLATGAW